MRAPDIAQVAAERVPLGVAEGVGLWRAGALLAQFARPEAGWDEITECLDEIRQQLHQQIFAIE